MKPIKFVFKLKKASEKKGKKKNLKKNYKKELSSKPY